MASSLSSNNTLPAKCCLCDQDTTTTETSGQDLACQSCGHGLVRSQEILEAIREEVANHSFADPAEVLASSRLQELGEDSLELLELIMILEERLEVSVSGDPQAIKTIGDFVRFVASQD